MENIGSNNENVPVIYECTHKGELDLGGKLISCAVLSNGDRIITQTALFDAFDRPRKGEKRQEGLPSIIGAKNLLPYINDDLKELAKPVHYYTDSGAIKTGYNALLIPEVCDAYLSLEDAGKEIDSQEKIIRQSHIIIRALAKVGITALVDEATGYQLDREADALQKLLKAYISEDFLKWQTRFPRRFYQEIFRLYGWEYNPLSLKRPQYVGKFTNEYVYDYMPEGVLEQLRIKNPKNEKGNRARRHHQFLTGDIGVPHLEKHITQMLPVMRLSKNIDEFKRNFYEIFGDPKKKKNTNQIDLEF
ncbi:P63C domain-containing protein [Acinetobacter sp. AG3]|jgi:P63C domain|uniref:P63C domain-containing protein n=1 Tax=unclassified Acinetobacter TaxID=196816 RepID=UPI001EF01C77|nr:P63C domain-containing protein [Acinetobacter sp. AG3]MCG7218957.1 P63C domain-containing protein [Acinetobacter sp. AG3]